MLGKLDHRYLIDRNGCEDGCMNLKCLQREKPQCILGLRAEQTQTALSHQLLALVKISSLPRGLVVHPAYRACLIPSFTSKYGFQIQSE